MIYRSNSLDSSNSANESPVPKRRKNDRIVSQLLKKASDSSRTKNEKSLGVDSSNGNKRKIIRQPDVVSHKKDFKKLKPKFQADLKSTAKQNASSSRALLVSSKKMDDSPGKKLQNVIPGLHNMKNVRRSLTDRLVKKYINVANQTQRKQQI
ncbi:unnamed protein product [Onchocerca ochengi]|uniref:Uncharacterized protein n=1 Tax=Onchocerca ochengi TaxID=42157 RepID=A0A182E4S5_ONCOC|nr:unnamed protein product [Onchocerca ochengi]